MATKKSNIKATKSPAKNAQMMGRALRQPNKREAEREAKAAEQRAADALKAAALQLAEKIMDTPTGEYKLSISDGFLGRRIDLRPADALSNCDKAARHQPHFTLLAQDNLTPHTLREWIELAEDNGVSHEKVKDAREVLKNIETWRTANPLRIKLPE